MLLEMDRATPPCGAVSVFPRERESHEQTERFLTGARRYCDLRRDAADFLGATSAVSDASRKENRYFHIGDDAPVILFSSSCGRSLPSIHLQDKERTVEAKPTAETKCNTAEFFFVFFCFFLA